MKVVGSAVVAVDRMRVWAALQDPAVLVRTIPGCERLEATGADTYRMTVTAGVASIKGVYQGEVALSDPQEPERFTLRARGAGAPGTVDATVLIRLSEAGEGGTRVDYDAEAVVGGMIGGVGQRMLGSVAKKTAGEFFSAVERHLRRAPAGQAPAVEEALPAAASGLGEEAGVPSLTGGPMDVESMVVAHPDGPAPSPAAVAGQVFERPREEAGQADGRPRAGTPVWPVLTAFGMGAGVALGSAVIGWLLGRTGRR
ncbi:carbon monoxide dehydrogenase subunit G [Sphaerisporangium melleum]|uniref:Carbon monoxide dehydrogenase subunit G n=1 Tax=Sphaerisporangium melleum TaxID=321316 RepID=A0A917VG71_9ACTN|nr:carbon monoxide dehydrogenase subunit G [Sphaerisporangium melleum]GGK71921.1 carbon monoxide dehydrogenase subunit G [Sphaerisporangium melleum]GII68398.1 carbon monoxide dehydrogenase subunit G [Sphaerisporangium melleum]